MPVPQRERSLALLKRLGGLKDWDFFPDPAVAVYETPFERYELAIGGDGKIFGGDAIWSMIQAMQSRWWEFIGNRKASWTASEEGRALQWFVANNSLASVAVEAVITSYAAWQEAIKDLAAGISTEGEVGEDA
jgi:hypothetical protein